MFSRFFLLIILILTFLNSLGSHLLSQSTHFLENQLELETKTSSLWDKVVVSTCCFGLACSFTAATIGTQLARTFIQTFCWDTKVEKELLLLSHMCYKIAFHLYRQLGIGSFKGDRKIPLSQSSWYENKKNLEKAPICNQSDYKLKTFLERRWLAKSSGFFPIITDWVNPSYSMFFQVHPQTEHYYARNPSTKLSKPYQERVDAWKTSLPHPYDFPLVLTRPANLKEFLPNYVCFSENEEINTLFESIKDQVSCGEQVFLDLKEFFKNKQKDKQKWLESWNHFQEKLFELCNESRVDSKKVNCIETLREGELGGVRLLTKKEEKLKEVDEKHKQFLQRVGFFGLAETRIELDRPIFKPFLEKKEEKWCTELQERENYIKSLILFYHQCESTDPQKSLMVHATLNLIQGLLCDVKEEKWVEIQNCPMRSYVVKHALAKIENAFNHLLSKNTFLNFFESMGVLELIHADLQALLEILSPYEREDFPFIYQNLLTYFPINLRAFTSFSLHTSGMSSCAGILKAAENMARKKLTVLYGENAYFECSKIAELDAFCLSVNNASIQDWKDVDLLLAQFNPNLRCLTTKKYEQEKIEDMLFQAFAVRGKKPLTLALDCTVDYINSKKVGFILKRFKKEIEDGRLNVICYRSGLKFDLFGMDNYCGAPLCMIHSKHSHWSFFDLLLKEEALLTDRLSLNWFCLAYKHTGRELDLFRSAIFANTRTLMDQIPDTLFDKSSPYQVIKTDKESDLTFIDIKTSGFCHALRGAVIAGGLLYLKCMENKIPIFYRTGFGFYHSNFSMLFFPEMTTIRLTLGLDFTEIDMFVKIFQTLDIFNQKSKHSSKNKR